MINTDRVFVYPNPTRENTQKALPDILDFLLAEGFKVNLESHYKDSLGGEYPVVSFLPEEEAVPGADFILVLGGDGTILHVASFASRYDRPVLGINLGTTGFLTELDISDIELLKNVLADKHHLDRRLLLDVTVVNARGETTFNATGLNDAAIMKGDIAKTVKLVVHVNNRRVMGFSGDGAVVCTPTGSTAYSLSAGGPILEPSSSCIAVTPVCPHSLGIKSFVVSSDRIIEITAPPQDNSIHLSVDGHQNRNMLPNERIIIRESEKTVSLIRLKGKGFYDRINEKLSIERI